MKLEDGVLHTFPLAGTRKRGKTEQEDLELEKELLADEKERAEHNMLVDLGRMTLVNISLWFCGSNRIYDDPQIFKDHAYMFTGRKQYRERL